MRAEEGLCCLLCFSGYTRFVFSTIAAAKQCVMCVAFLSLSNMYVNVMLY